MGIKHVNSIRRRDIPDEHAATETSPPIIVLQPQALAAQGNYQHNTRCPEIYYDSHMDKSKFDHNVHILDNKSINQDSYGWHYPPREGISLAVATRQPQETLVYIHKLGNK